MLSLHIDSHKLTPMHANYSTQHQRQSRPGQLCQVPTSATRVLTLALIRVDEECYSVPSAASQCKAPPMSSQSFLQSLLKLFPSPLSSFRSVRRHQALTIWEWQPFVTLLCTGAASSARMAMSLLSGMAATITNVLWCTCEGAWQLSRQSEVSYACMACSHTGTPPYKLRSIGPMLQCMLPQMQWTSTRYDPWYFTWPEACG